MAVTFKKKKPMLNSKGIAAKKYNTMNTDETLKQRNIGKYLMMVNIIRLENDHARHTGISFVSRDDMAAWASVEKKEIDKLIEYCRCFDPYILASYAATEFLRSANFESEKNAHFYVTYTGKNYGKMFILCPEANQQSDLYEVLAKNNYEIYCNYWKEYPVSEIFRSAEVFREIACNYESYFCTLVLEAIDDGYEWDVICEMLGYEIERERFDILVKSSLNGLGQKCRMQHQPLSVGSKKCQK